MSYLQFVCMCSAAAVYYLLGGRSPTVLALGLLTGTVIYNLSQGRRF